MYLSALRWLDRHRDKSTIMSELQLSDARLEELFDTNDANLYMM